MNQKKPDRYVYPAVFTYYGPGKEIAVVFPDLNCATSGEDDEDALFSAREPWVAVLPRYLPRRVTLP